MFILSRQVGIPATNRVAGLLLAVLAAGLVLDSSATAQPCSCDSFLPPGMIVAQTYKIEDGLAPGFFTGFQGGGTTDVGHANLFSFSPGTRINYVCIGLRDQNALALPQAAVRVRAPDAAGNPGVIIQQTNFTVDPVFNHQIVQLVSELTLSGQIWFEVVYFSAEPGWSHQGTRPSTTSRTVIRLGNGPWTDYDNPNVFPGIRAVIRPQFLVPSNCEIRIENFSSTQTTEPGGSVTFQVRLVGTAPASNVTLNFGSSDPSEGVCSINQIIFTPQNWNIPRTITVTGQDDTLVDGNIAYFIFFSNSISTDPCWDNLAVAPIALENLDDEGPCLVRWENLSSSSTTESGGSVTFDVRLLGQAPGFNVTIDFSSSDSSEGFVSTNRLVFTPQNWSIPRSVTVAGVDDAEFDGDTPYSIDFASSSSGDACWNGLTIPGIALINLDDEPPCQILVGSPSSIHTSEIGSTISTWVALSGRAPTSDVILDFFSSDPTEGLPSTGRLVFTPANWSEGNVLIVIGQDDSLLDGNVPYSLVFAASISNDPCWSGLSVPSLSLVNVDDEYADPCAPRRLGKLVDPDGTSPDWFGSGVALSDRWAVIGNRVDSGVTFQGGSVSVFESVGSGWILNQKLSSADLEDLDAFGASVAVSGNRLVVGATDDDDLGIASGSVYVFDYNGSSWIESAKLHAQDGGWADGFGGSVALLGDRLVVGAAGQDGAGEDRGALYVFEFNGNSWVQAAKLLPSNATRLAHFGLSLQLANDRIVTGAGNDNSGSGSVFVFERLGGVWTETAKLTPSGAGGTNFGSAVSLSGDRLLVGARQWSGSLWRAGAAHLFTFNGSNWIESALLTASDAAENSEFGVSVALQGNRALVGAHRDSERENRAGATYLFEFDGSSWQEQHKIIPVDAQGFDHNGLALAMREGVALIVAPGGAGTGATIGAVYVYDLLIGLARYGVGLAGSGGEVPGLRAAGCALLGNRIDLEIHSGLGRAAGFLLLGFGRASVPFRGGTLWVQSPFNSFPVQLGGSPGVPGAGSLNLPIDLPNNPGLIGLPINIQVALFDSGATVGVALTNGLELIVDQ